MQVAFKQSNPRKNEIEEYLRRNYSALGDHGLDIFATFNYIDRMADEDVTNEWKVRELSKEWPMVDIATLRRLVEFEPQQLNSYLRR